MQPTAPALVLLFALYVAGGRLGAALTVMPEGPVILWLPNAVLLAALLRYGLARYWALAATALAAEVAAGWGLFSPLESLLFGLVNLGEATLAWAILRRWRFDAQLATGADLGKLFVAGPGLSALAAAFLGAAVYQAFRGGDTTYFEFVRIWWFGDALGLMVLTPALLGFAPYGRARPVRRAPGLLDLAVWVGVLAALALFWFDPGGRGVQMHFGPALLLPFVLFVAARQSARWTALAVSLSAVAIAAVVTAGRPPFSALAPRDAVVLAQEFIFIMALMALGLSALLGHLRGLNEGLEMRVAERTAALERANARLAELATHDDLTGLYNRRGLFELAQREFARARRSGRALALVMMDLDHFKDVNDRHGHLAGDEVLKDCAARLAQHARASDLCARFGGEEFLLVAPDSDLEGASALAERVRRAIAETPQGGIAVTASFGVSVMAREDASLDAVIKRADDALYAAKSGGRNRVAAASRPPS